MSSLELNTHPPLILNILYNDEVFFVQKKASVIKTGSTIYLSPLAEASRNWFDAGNSAKPRYSVLTNACDLPWCELLSRFAILEMDFLLWREPQNMSQ